MGTPCTTVRSETEWEETLVGHWNVLVPDPAGIRPAVDRSTPEALRGHPFGDGTAAPATVRVLESAMVA